MYLSLYLERAVARGQLPRGTSAAELITAVAAPLYYRLLITAEPLNEATADRAAAAALAAARSGVFTSGMSGDSGGPDERRGAGVAAPRGSGARVRPRE